MFGSIRCLFQLMHDFFDFDKLYPIFFFLEKLRDKKLIYVVRLVFYVM